MSIEQLIPNKPKQKRSLERYQKILDTVEKILIEEGIHVVSIQEVSTAMKWLILEEFGTYQVTKVRYLG